MRRGWHGAVNPCLLLYAPTCTCYSAANLVSDLGNRMAAASGNTHFLPPRHLTTQVHVLLGHQRGVGPGPWRGGAAAANTHTYLTHTFRAPLPHRCMCYSATNVVSGQGRGVVVQ